MGDKGGGPWKNIGADCWNGRRRLWICREMPHIELTGNRELRMENHKGILAYGGEEIRISGGKLEITVRGRGLELRAMNAGQLFITGTIQGVELC